MSETILILGCGVMQIPALRIAAGMGWRVAAADGNSGAEGRSLAHRFFHVDLKDIGGLIDAARLLRDEGGLSGVFTAGTDFSYSAACVSEAMGLPGHSPGAALNATDKVLMRRRFRDEGVPSPAFAEIGPNENPSAALNAIPGPWVVKPVDSMGARGVIRIDRAADLGAALDRARSFSRSGRALVETYMDGPEFSLDALVTGGRIIRCGLADRHIVFPPCFIEIGHTIPSAADVETAESVWEVFGRGVRALGLTHGAAKGDVKLTAEGPMIGEIAARLSGGYMSGWTYPYASGVEPTRAALRLAAGLPAEISEPDRSLFCAERALISIDGTLKKLDGREAALALPGVRDVFLRSGPGDRVVFPRNNVEKAGNVIAVGSTGAEAAERAGRALRILDLELNPADPATGVFLDGEGPFPPDAFSPACSGEEKLSDFLNDLWRRCPPKPSRGCQVRRPRVPAVPASRCTDYTGRTVAEVLDILDGAGLIRLENPAAPGADREPWLSDFWKALIRGGLPGARWYLEQTAL